MFRTVMIARETITVKTGFATPVNATQKKVLTTLLISVQHKAQRLMNVYPRSITGYLPQEYVRAEGTLTEIFTVVKCHMITMERNISEN